MRLSVRSLLAVAAVVALVGGPAAGRAVAAPASVGVPMQAMAVCDVPVVGLVCDAAGSAKDAVAGAAGWTFSQVFGAIASWVGDGASWLVGRLASFLGDSVDVDLADRAFVGRYRVMGALALALALPLLILSVIQSIIRQDAGQMIRSAAAYLPVAMVVMVAGVELTRTGVELTDWMSTAAAGGTSGDVRTALTQFAGVLAAGAAAGVPMFVFFLVAALVAFAALAIWAELLLRAAAIYACLLFLPLVLAALLWPATAHWCRRLIHTLVALILSKFVIVATLGLGVSLVSAGPTDAGFNALLTGGVLLFLAAMSPFVLLRLIPVAEAAAVAHLEGRARRGLAAAGTGAGGVAFTKSLIDARGGQGPMAALGGQGAGAVGTAGAARLLGMGGPLGVAAYLAAGAATRGAARATPAAAQAIPPQADAPHSKEGTRGRQ